MGGRGEEFIGMRGFEPATLSLKLHGADCRITCLSFCSLGLFLSEEMYVMMIAIPSGGQVDKIVEFGRGGRAFESSHLWSTSLIGSP